MKKKLYSVRDRVAGIFFNPFTDLIDASAIRNFDLAVTSDERCDDLELYAVGLIDDSTGEVFPIEIKRLRTGMESKVHLKSNDIEGE